MTKPNCINQPSSKLKYGFCKKSLWKNGKKSEPKVFNWSEFHFFYVTFYKIHILVSPRGNKDGSDK